MSAAVATPKKAAKPKVVKKPAAHPKYTEMIAAAVGSLKERGGSSRQAILKYIVKTYNVGKDERVVNQHLKMALRAGVKKGALKQSKGSGASGSFRLGDKVAPTKKAVAKKPKSPAKVKKAKSPKKAVAKKAKSPAKAKKAAKKPAVAKVAKKPKAAPKAKKPAAVKAKKAKTPVKAKKAAKPKKASLYSTHNFVVVVVMSAAVATPKKAAKPKVVKKPAAHPKYTEMIAAAVGSLKERGGSSRQAILKYIVKTYNVGKDERVVNQHLKMALRAGVKKGALKQSKGSGASGSFRLGDKVAPTKKAVAKKPKSPAKVKKAKSPKKAVAKKAKSPAKAKKAAKKPAVAKVAKKPKAAPKAKKPAAVKAKKAKTPVKAKKAAKPKKAAPKKA
ncbi:hypothetical protein NP493_7376g00007 [Ridgeia piscesae]|uniref:H15 domain-containing protein n=1 Tax=Ridgeia piscesae TaxID=27915 RepID=A0AAD9IRD9_RIDPI|nr:hypothetical protein NP493_7376g00007 [Ridgeia piscesae]